MRVPLDEVHTETMARFRVALGMADDVEFVLTYELDFGGGGAKQTACMRSELPDGEGLDSLINVIPNGTVMVLQAPGKSVGDIPKKRRRSGGRVRETNDDDVLAAALKQQIGTTVRRLFVLTSWAVFSFGP